MTANLTIPLQGADDVLAVPLAAVFTDKGDRFAYVRDGGRYERRPIRIGVTDYDFAEVISGLKDGETVSLVTPPEEAGKAQQAFGATGRGAGGGMTAGREGRGAGGGATGGRGGERQGAAAPGAGAAPSAAGERPSGRGNRGPRGEGGSGGERRGPPSGT